MRLLFLSDTHLGFDLPARPRTERPRRGAEFFESFEAALAPARDGEVDVVVHGGDLLYRSRVPAWLSDAALAPLRRVADSGVPVVLLPGNHERGRMPHPLLALHPRIHLLDRPRTVVLEAGGVRVAFTGFPHERGRVPHPLLALHRNLHLLDRPRTVVLEAGGVRVAFAGFPYAREVRDRFPALLDAATAGASPADVRLLCLHQCVEGATCGPADFTFRHGPDVIPRAALPPRFDAVLCGHVHRHQVLRATGAPPVIYAGSTERTSHAEAGEAKGVVLLWLSEAGIERHAFRPLPDHAAPAPRAAVSASR